MIVCLSHGLDEDKDELIPEWREELQRRACTIDAGKAILIPSAVLWNEINQRLGTTF